MFVAPWAPAPVRLRAGRRDRLPGMAYLTPYLVHRAAYLPVHRSAVVTYPRGKGFASLRLHAEDASGRSFDQTVIRAYRFG